MIQPVALVGSSLTNGHEFLACSHTKLNGA
jgi:hypothetical protein